MTAPLAQRLTADDMAISFPLAYAGNRHCQRSKAEEYIFATIRHESAFMTFVH